VSCELWRELPRAVSRLYAAAPPNVLQGPDRQVDINAWQPHVFFEAIGEPLGPPAGPAGCDPLGDRRRGRRPPEPDGAAVVLCTPPQGMLLGQTNARSSHAASTCSSRTGPADKEALEARMRRVVVVPSVVDVKSTLLSSGNSVLIP
jgi:hypothetical protein